jgi:hypothetical protein
MSKEEKPKRAKKPINVKIDTKNIDIEIKRDEDGDVQIDVDTKKVDAHFKKDESGISLDIEIDDQKEYQFESFGTRTMPKGTVWKVTGELLKIFLKRGIGKLKQ